MRNVTECGLVITLWVMICCITNGPCLASSRSDTLGLPLRKHYPQHEFQLPLGIPTSLRAGFASFREDHFHSGLDLSTNGKEGAPVLAAAGGYVSRIKIQSGGYGQALYITHPNGFVTVYGHLQGYAGAIAGWVSEVQRSHHTYEMDVYPHQGELAVAKGMLVAFSGDTGYSGGPHLHFEIRDAVTEEIINPLLLGFNFKDHVPPVIKGLELFSYNEQNGISTLAPIGFFPAKRVATGVFTLAGALPVKLPPELIVGITCDDMLDGGTHKFGVFGVTLFDENKVVFESSFERFSFDRTRAINSYLDYPLSRRGKFVQRSYREPGNDATLYPVTMSRGILNLRLDSVHNMRYEVTDAAGNRSVLSFKLKPASFAGPLPESSVETTHSKPAFIQYSQDQTVYFNTSGEPADKDHGDFGLYFPAHCLFNNMLVGLSGGSDHWNIGDPNQAIKDSVLLTVDRALPGSLDKWVVRRSPGHPLISFKTSGKLSVWLKAFGPYSLYYDTIPPKITGLHIFGDGNLAVSFTVGDPGSGIKRYEASVDQHWVMLRYDQKNNKMWFRPETPMSQGQHNLEIIVTDRAGNTTTLQTRFKKN